MIFLYMEGIFCNSEFTFCVDNDMHGVHTDTVALSPSVLIKCSICSYHPSLTRTLHEWLKKAFRGM